jgi:hypothetical protein
MRIFYKGKDGGPQSPVTGYWLIEIKGLFSIVLLKFNQGCREAFHNHAFNALTWFIKGDLLEERLDESKNKTTFTAYKRSIIPKITKRDNFHRVWAQKTSWCLSIRGPWSKTWNEYKDGKLTTLTHGRKIIL